MEDKNNNIMKILEGIDSLNIKNSEGGNNANIPKKKISIEQCLALFKIMNSMKIMKTDKEPIEIIEGLYIGTFATSNNKEGLINNKITHILIVASSLKANFPEVSLKSLQ